MKFSRKVPLIFSIILVAFSLALIIFNNVFFEEFYDYRQANLLKETYSDISDYIEDTEAIDIRSEQFIFKINTIGDEKGIVVCFFDSNGNNIDIYKKNLIMNINQLVGIDSKSITESGFSFDLKFENNPQENNVAYIGKIVKDNEVKGYCLTYVLKTNIKESVSVFNTYIIYGTVIISIIGLIVIYFVSKKLLKPLKDVEEKTRKISELDFSTKLDVISNDEVGSLAVSINKMSSELEKVIDDLKVANAKLEDDIKLKERVNKLREEFISDVSHELKTPIAIISGYSEALKLDGLNFDDINEYSDIIIDECKRMDKLVRDLLKFTQIESGFLNLDSEDFKFNELVEDVIKPLELKIKEQQINLEIKLDELFINGDYEMLQTVFKNLFTNAINYSINERKIIVSYENKKDKYRINIYNSGDNISEENIERIWDSFFKADKSRSRSYGGSGLGLSIVKSIMENYHNEYGVINEKDGVTFYFEVNKTIKKD